MNKAGSTSIQRAFQTYRDRNIEFIRPRDDTTLHAVLDRTFRRPRDVATFSNHPEVLEEAASTFDRLMGRSDRSAFISYENLSIWPDRDVISAIRDRLLLHCRSVHVLAYIRSPRSYIRSVLQERLKQYSPPEDLAKLRPHYRERFERWDAVFGNDAVELVPFRTADLVGGDLLTDVCERIGAQRKKLARQPQANEAGTLESAAALAVWQTARPDGEQTKSGVGQLQLIRFAQRIHRFGQISRWGFEGPAIDQVIEDNTTDIEWISERLGIADFGDEPPPPSTIPNITDLIALGQDLAPDLADWLLETVPGFQPPRSRQTADLMQAAFVQTAKRDWRAQVFMHRLMPRTLRAALSPIARRI
ncbi:hypothetical protein AADZ90_021440 [Aestuariibius sp. 2305UL40-4]|uniref:hypothetical protein n=1 Tax=Aestuariibius violaceus TaxID=3234132 RepID=UPI00345EB236